MIRFNFKLMSPILKLPKIFMVVLISLLTCLAVVITRYEQSQSVSYFQVSGDLSPYILVDQFGYRCRDPKVAVIVQPLPNPKLGNLTFPSLLTDQYQVFSSNSNNPVYEAAAQIWQNGSIHDQSGDQTAWFDFSSVQESGSYMIRNVRTGETSATFEISDVVYRDALIAATRMFFYQRSGFAKQPPFADPRWADEASFLHPGQDTEARFVNDKDNTSLERDMRGGWFDAGDTNKYVTFAAQTIHQLLTAYTQNPGIWTDDFNIPESGNGIPDLLDELRFELDWLQRMQDEDGGVFIKIGNLNHDLVERPSLDQRPRYYGPKCSSSTIATASMFAHTAWVFKTIPALVSEAEDLQDSALSAWDWFVSHPQQIDCDTQEIKSGDADRSLDEQTGLAVSAAVYLLALTEEKTYNDYILQNFLSTRPFREFGWSVYEPYVGDALLDYTLLEETNTIAHQQIIDSFTGLVQSLLGDEDDFIGLDPYRAYLPNDQYHWGSNAVKSNAGNAIYDLVTYAIDSNKTKNYEARSLDFLHYIHGINPFGMVYLTNMYDYGAELSANEMYHEWLGHGIYKNALTSPSGPAPGYVTGGPNKNYTGSAPLASYPPMRAYLDSGESGELRMWEITEPSISYQSAYIKLLSKFISMPVK